MTKLRALGRVLPIIVMAAAFLTVSCLRLIGGGRLAVEQDGSVPNDADEDSSSRDGAEADGAPADGDQEGPPVDGDGETAPCGAHREPCCVGGVCDPELTCSGVLCSCARYVESDEWRTCVLDAAGHVICWGDNTNGELGDPSVVGGSTRPVTVTNLPSVIDFDLGAFHGCAWTAVGEVYCWGLDEHGQLGDGSIGGARAVPEMVTGLPPVVALALGGYHSCALTQDDELFCWGINDEGQLGLGAAGYPEATPQLVGTFPGATSIAAGGFHTCVAAGGELWCWGRNDEGQIGNGSTGAGVPTQVLVAGLPVEISSVTGGDWHTCALGDDTNVYCWGGNALGQLGRGNTSPPEPNPDIVTGLADVIDLFAADDHTCAIDGSLDLSCWGDNLNGQIGDGIAGGERTDPTTVVDLPSVVDVAGGRRHTCGLTEVGDVLCWGLNSSGELGDGSTENRALPGPTIFDCSRTP